MSLDSRDRFRKAFLLVLVIGISAVFVEVIRPFIVTLLLAAIASGLCQPLYRRLLGRLKGRQTVAAVLTILLVFLVIVGPLTGFLGIVASEAYRVSQVVRPFIQEQIRQPSPLEHLVPRWVPFLDKLAPYRTQILSTLGDLAGRLGNFLVRNLSAMTKGTVAFFFQLFIMLYAMFFFLISGRELLARILSYLPLSDADKERMLEKFLSVTRATVKGTLVIGMLQGGLAGIAFATAGIQGAAFWGTVMAVFSIIPGIGPPLVWVPAVLYLLLTGKVVAGVLLALWCALVVGTLDNFLRPRLVGKDAKLPDLLILLGTLGGILYVGAVGIVIGPIIAALFVTVWDIYGVAFRDFLGGPQVATAPAGGPPGDRRETRPPAAEPPAGGTTGDPP